VSADFLRKPRRDIGARRDVCEFMGSPRGSGCIETATG
jgi:hypothetical protein